MVNSAPNVLQIVPKIPGDRDGVGDYALSLARILSTDFGITTSFAVASELELSRKNHEHLILHYVNYGYQKRGVPFGLLSSLRSLRRNSPSRLVTVFHELYASGPVWQSAFWLQPFQRYIARSIARISDVCLVSSETMLHQLRALCPNVCAEVQPVFSNFGEPSLLSDQFSKRDPRRWVICGGTALIERSLHSFRAILNRIPEFFSPRELFVLGGSDNPATRSLLADLANVRVDYRPQIDAGEASQVLSTCSFGWLDYFLRPDVPSDVILKSSAFGAMCAHGVIPVFPHRGSPITIDDDALPDPYFMDARFIELPSANDREKIASQIYHWYQRQASSEHRAHTIARALGLETAKAKELI
jgi:hypothetical protein